MQSSSLRILLLPFTPLYRAGLAVRESSLRAGREPVRRLQWPVVSIGNLSTGGSGKTPLTIALAQALSRRGARVDVLSRGYGRSSREAVQVDPNGAAEEFGDEPLVIARDAGVPVYVAAERYEAGVLAERDFAASQKAASASAALKIHLLDDGFQHRQLARTVDILLLNRRDWRDHLLPAGNLREPRTAIGRADVIALPANDPELEAKLERYGWTGPVWRLRRDMDVPPVAGPVIAFCGIAHSGQFFAGLEAAGLHLASRVAFADHHPYAAHDIDCLLDAARSVRATTLMTTEKDQARLGALVERIPGSLTVVTAKLSVKIDDEAAAIDWLIGRLRPVT